MRFHMVSIIVFLVVSASAAWSGPMCDALLKHPGIADEVGLTDEQRVQLDDLVTATEKQIIDSEADIRIKQVEIDRLVRSDQPDMRQIRKLVNEAGDARSSLRLARIERDVKMRQLLTPDQALRARKAMTARMREWKGHRRPTGTGGPHMGREGFGGGHMRGGRGGPQMRKEACGGRPHGDSRGHRTGERDCREGMRHSEMHQGRHPGKPSF